MQLFRAATVAVLAAFASACSETTSPTAPAGVPSAPAFSLTAATGTTGPISSGAASGQCVDVVNISHTSGARTQLWNCSGGVNQQWSWQSDNTIRVYAGALCLDLAGGQSANGTAVIVATCTGQASQQWTASSAGEIKGLNGMCLDATNFGTANGTLLQVWSCGGGTNQKWANSVSGAAAAPPVLVGTPVYPGQSIQAAVNANPAGTTFILKSGTHVQQTVIPKQGDVFHGEPGTVLDGQGAAQWAFRGYSNNGWVNGVTIRALKITNYAPPFQDGAISGGSAPGNGSVGWVVDSNEVSYNGYFGIRIGDRMQVTNNNVHHNAVSNISGAANGVLVQNNEIAWGNYRRTGDLNFESGGTKFTLTDSLVLRGNYVHDNQGVGLWTDEANIHTLIENNNIVNNACEGILREKGYDAVIRNNTITGNGWNDPRGNLWLWNAGIVIAASSNVEIYGNVVSGNLNGITGIQQNRGSGPYGTYLVQNLYVHDNTITQTVSQVGGNPPHADAAAGLVEDDGGTGIFSGRNNRYMHNTYYLHRIATNVSPGFEFQGWKTDPQWQALGMDTNGTFYRNAP